MNRRGFLGAIAAAFVVDPERALWVPGRKLISVPAPRVRIEMGFAPRPLVEMRFIKVYTPRLDHMVFHDFAFVLDWPPLAGTCVQAVAVPNEPPSFLSS